jgi:hypothetical protein
MANNINRDEVVCELLRIGVEPPDWLDAWLAGHEKGLADPFIFLPSPQGMVPVLFWTDRLRNAIIQTVIRFEGGDGVHWIEWN